MERKSTARTFYVVRLDRSMNQMRVKRVLADKSGIGYLARAKCNWVVPLSIATLRTLGYMDTEHEAWLFALQRYEEELYQQEMRIGGHMAVASQALNEAARVERDTWETRRIIHQCKKAVGWPPELPKL